MLNYVDFNHVEFVNGAIDRTGVKLDLSEEHSDGKGILIINDPTSLISDSIFTVVSVKRLSPTSLIIVNEVPTAEGIFVLTTAVRDDKQKTIFEIQKWPSPNLYNTTFSRLTLALKPNGFGITSGKIEYKGKSNHGQKEIRLVNDFYYK